MGCLGVLYALTAEEVTKWRSFTHGVGLVEYLYNDFEQREFGGEWCEETNKAWDAIHRCFAGGTLDVFPKDYPLNCVILGGETLQTTNDFIISLKSPQLVQEIADKMSTVTKEYMKTRYWAIDPDDYGMELNANDEGFTCEYFHGLIDFYKRAAHSKRWAAFTVDQ